MYFCWWKLFVAVLYSSRPSIQRAIRSKFSDDHADHVAVLYSSKPSIQHWQENIHNLTIGWSVAVLYSSRPSIQQVIKARNLIVENKHQKLPSSIHRGLRYNKEIVKEAKKEIQKQLKLPSSIHRGLRYNENPEKYEGFYRLVSCRPLFIEAFDTTWKITQSMQGQHW